MQEVVTNYVERWQESTSWQLPDLTDAIDFLVTEVAEVVDARLRQDPRYVRARRGVSSKIIEELADVVFMAYVTAIVLEEDLDAALYTTLDRLTVRFKKFK